MIHRIIIQYLHKPASYECVVAVQDWNTLDFLLLTLKVLVSKQNQTVYRYIWSKTIHKEIL